MARHSKARPRNLWRTIGILILFGAAYWYQQHHGGGKPTEPPNDPPSAPVSPPASSPANGGSSAAIRKVNGYDQLDGCRLVDHRNNDGDSFQVRHGDRQFELRLYYVDSAEKYLSDRYENQRRRVGEQARDFGGITIDQTVELGQQAKVHTLDVLKGKTFTVYTKWEQVYDGDRYYGFVKLPDSDEFLAEELVEQGLVRIHTKGETTPEGVSFYKHRDHLRALEKEAKAAARGAWGL